MAIPPTPTPTTADRVQLDLLRAAGSERRSALGLSLSMGAIEMARAALARRHPEYDEREVRLALAEINYGKDLAARVRQRLAEG